MSLVCRSWSPRAGLGSCHHRDWELSVVVGSEVCVSDLSGRGIPVGRDLVAGGNAG